MEKEEEDKTPLNKEHNKQEDIEDKNSNKSESKKGKPILIKRKTEKKENELLTYYELGNLQDLDLESENEKLEIEKLIHNILLSCNFSFMIYAFSKIYGYLKSLLFYNLFYFIGLKLIYKVLNTKKEEDITPSAALWKRLLLFNLPELILIFYYYKRKLTEINTAIYSSYTYFNERLSFVFNSDDTKKYLCQIDGDNYNIIFFKKGENNFNKENIVYLNKTEILAEDTFFDSVIAYPNANFEDFDFNNLSEEEEKLYQDIFTFINEVEKKVKEECSLYNTIGTICSNLSFNNSGNYQIKNALIFKVVSFAILEIYLNNIKKRKRRNELFEVKVKNFNESNMEKGYFLAVNEYIILLFKLKENYKNFDESYNELKKKCKKFLDCYFDEINKKIF